MNYSQPIPNQQPEHLQMAISVANELLSRFTLIEQNEAVAMISRQIREARINETHELQIRIEIIQKSLENMPLPVFDQAKESRY